MNDCILYGHLQYQSNKHKATFLTSAMAIIEWTPKGWFCYCMMLEKATAINCVWLFPCHCRKRNSPNKWGFLCVDLLKDVDADLHLKYQDRLVGWGVQIIHYLINTLPKEANDILDE